MNKLQVEMRKLEKAIVKTCKELVKNVESVHVSYSYLHMGKYENRYFDVFVFSSGSLSHAAYTIDANLSVKQIKLKIQQKLKKIKQDF